MSTPETPGIHKKVAWATYAGVAATVLGIILAALGAIPQTENNEGWIVPVIAAITTAIMALSGYAAPNEPAATRTGIRRE